MRLTPEILYLQLGQLVADMPDFGDTGPIGDEVNSWLGRATALLDQCEDASDRMTFRLAAQGLSGLGHKRQVQTIKAIVYAALARSEIAAPAGTQGRFIPAGGEFDAFAAFGKVVQAANREILIVDPYSDEILLSDFAIQVKEGVNVKILTDHEYYKPTLKPAMERWNNQYGSIRPIEIRKTSRKKLHDRLIFVDQTVVWNLGQSLNMIAKRAPTSILKLDHETAKLKISAYEQMWSEATDI
jgi:hypothetical protein